MSVVLVLSGVVIVSGAFLDMINTLVNTTTSTHRLWLSRLIGESGWKLVRLVAVRIPEGETRERFLAGYAPVLILVLLAAWIGQQIIGFALIWYGLGGISGAESFADTVYFSGVVFFTVGFGEVVPVDVVPRFGVLLEAFAGVLTIALVVGFLPALYSAYSGREQLLMTLDDGREGRVSPTNLIVAWSPDGDTGAINERFGVWEDWVTRVLETHTTHPMLRLFRSHHYGQNWITALGLMCDAAHHAQLIKETRNREAYWFLRRATVLFSDLTNAGDVEPYRRAMVESFESGNSDLFDELYVRLEEHGFDLIPYEDAVSESQEARLLWAPAMEYLIDTQMTPRGFWSHQIGLPLIQLPGIGTGSNGRQAKG